LKDVLTALKPGLAKTKVVEQMSHFIFTGQDIVTYNDKILVSFPYETDFPFSISAEKFFGLVSNMSSPTIEVIQDGKSIKIEGKAIKAGIRTMQEDELGDSIQAVKDQAAEGGWQPLPEDFVEGVFLSSFSASSDESQGTATCVYAIGNMLYAGDRTRVSQFRMAQEVKEPFFLKAIVAPDISGYYVTEVTQSKSWIHFRTEDGLNFSTRKVVGQFPNYAPFFEKFEGDKLLLPGKELKEAIKTVTIIKKEDDPKGVIVKMMEGKLLCSYTTNEGREWIEKEMELDYKGETVEIGMNAEFLSQVLEKAVEVIISPDRQRMLFQSDNFKHILSAMVS